MIRDVLVNYQLNPSIYRSLRLRGGLNPVAVLQKIRTATGRILEVAGLGEGLAAGCIGHGECVSGGGV
jgi:hypothetical protein